MKAFDLSERNFFQLDSALKLLGVLASGGLPLEYQLPCRYAHLVVVLAAHKLNEIGRGVDEEPAIVAKTLPVQVNASCQFAGPAFLDEDHVHLYIGPLVRDSQNKVVVQYLQRRALLPGVFGTAPGLLRVPVLLAYVARQLAQSQSEVARVGVAHIQGVVVIVGDAIGEAQGDWIPEDVFLGCLARSGLVLLRDQGGVPHLV